MLDIALLTSDMLVALVDLRGLREPCSLLVDRLGGEEPGHFRAQVLQAHWAVVFEQRMKGVVADPRLVPKYVVAEMADLLEYLSDVVDRAVIGRELNAGEAERTV